MKRIKTPAVPLRKSPRRLTPELSYGHELVTAKLQAMLQESGDPALQGEFDVGAWVDRWIRLPVPEFEGRTPEQELRKRNGWERVELLLERIRGGLCA